MSDVGEPAGSSCPQDAEDTDLTSASFDPIKALYASEESLPGERDLLLFCLGN